MIRILERKINHLKKEVEDEDLKSAGLCPFACSKMRGKS